MNADTTNAIRRMQLSVSFVANNFPRPHHAKIESYATLRDDLRFSRRR